MIVSDTDTLYYRGGSSDKFYTISVVCNDEGLYSVPFTYGRRGTSGRDGFKTTNTSKEEAYRVYHKMKDEKLRKGYEVGPSYAAPTSEDGLHIETEPEEPEVSTEEPVDQPVFQCQLLTEIDENEVVNMVACDGYCGQEKHDGKRLSIRYFHGDVSAFNKKGKLCDYPVKFKEALTEISNTSGLKSFLIDGELVKDQYFAFDMLNENDRPIGHLDYESRLESLSKLLEDTDTCIHLVYTAVTLEEKKELIQRLYDEHREGIVFKRLTAPYSAGRGEDWWKYKFYATASFIVLRVNTKRSVALGILDGEEIKDVGNCTIPPNKDIPSKDDIIEVRYLYAYKGGKIYQPTYLEPREDVTADECVISQLKYKPAA